MSDDLYCKVYLAGAADSAAAKAAISAATGQRFERRGAQVAGLRVEVFDNGQPGWKATDADDDFVRWPVCLEVEPMDADMAQPAFITALAGLLNRLDAQGLRSVPSCNFEDELAAARRTPVARSDAPAL
ncbi:hypothetical protein [Rubrivivax gelatinosus]|uniref:Uncharacterized protein n=1 Tax=Rubrivivax gelatinosus TaxID=28068 RepID=A0A4R2MAH7_RUBGE|nr:hypothetical protein [Rubrivivax gelatinosus]MBK1690200.1 hypothetical protein [Rubrivivax gelatinosus]TCP03470.1 hypothetical protein EV684_104191 [Rubrivivax gelatinosus]